MRVCYACDSDKVVQYHRHNRGHGIVGWYTNYPTDLVLCNRCNNHLVKRHKHKYLPRYIQLPQQERLQVLSTVNPPT